MPVADIGGLDIAYERAGEGPPVLLVAGTGYPGGTWPPEFVLPLAAHFTVITFDHRGTGGTPGTPAPYSTRLFAGDALGLLRTIGASPAHVVAHSMGGRVAQWMAIEGGEDVSRLVLASTGPGSTDGSHQSRGVPVQTAVRLTELGYEGYIRDLQRRTFFTEEFAAENPDAVTWLFDAFWKGRPSVEDYLKHVVARQEHDAVARLGEIGVPALVVVGDQDTLSGATGSHLQQSRYLAEHLPRAELVVVPGVKHGMFWERAGPVADLISSWLRGPA